jgi:hypothetical protein
MTDTSQTKLREVQPADAEQVHRLLRRQLPDVLDDLHRWQARWQWQTWNNPYRGGRPAGWVLIDRGEIAGHLGAVYLPMRLGPERVTAVVGTDYAVDEAGAARGGVFAGLQLAEAFFEAASGCLAMATTANEKTGAVFGRFGCRPVPWTQELWRAPATLQQQIRTCLGGTSRLMRRALTGWARPVVGGFLHAYYDRLNHLPAIPIPANSRLETTVPRLAGDLGWIWEGFVHGRAAAANDEDLAEREAVSEPPAAASSPMVVSVDRTQAYLNWRYGSHPEREHIRVLAVRDREGPPAAAMIVFLEQRADRRIALVEELLTLPHRRDALVTLFCAAVGLACDHGMDVLLTTPGRPDLRGLFWELGFESRARSAPALVMHSPEAVLPRSITFPTSFENNLDFWHGEMF